MKKKTAIILIISLLINILSGLTFAYAETNPIDSNLSISNEDDLIWFRTALAAGNTYEGQIVILTEDIVLTEDWSSQAYGEFKGTFDGCGHIISGLVINATSENKTCLYGLFRSNSGVIRNLSISGNISVACSSDVNDYSAISMLCAQNSGVIDNCSTYGTITRTGTSTGNIGAIAASNSGNGIVSNCSNYASVQNTNYPTTYDYYNDPSTTLINIGGVVGFNNNSSVIINCLNAGSVYSNSSQGYANNCTIGGVCGYNWGSKGSNGPFGSTGASVLNCLNVGSVRFYSNGTMQTYKYGGIVGYNGTYYHSDYKKYSYGTLDNNYFDSTKSSYGIGHYYVTPPDDNTKSANATSLTSGTVLNGLNSYIASNTGSINLLKWEQGDSYPVIHTHTYSYSETDADCINYGQYHYYSTCDGCEIDILYNHKKPLGHTVVIDEAILPDCVTSGLTEGAHCSVCNEILLAQEYVAPLGHTTVTDEAICPSCVDTGLTEGSHCSVCGKVFIQQYELPALGHSIVTDSAISPTCTETGLTEGTHCSTCGEVFTAQTSIDAKGHSIVTDKRIEPSCIAEGLTQGYHCSVCKTILLKQTTIAALGHNHISTVIPKTCTTQGYTTHECSRCDDEYVDTYVEASHEWNVGIITKPADCVNDGCCHHECLMCDATYDEVLSALGHNYETRIVSPTKTEFGYTEYTCTRCNDTYIADYVMPLGFDINIHANCKEISIHSDEFPVNNRVIVGFYDENGKLLKSAITSWQMKETFIVSVMDMNSAKTCKIFYLSNEYSPLTYQLPTTLELKYAHEYTASIDKFPTCIETGIMRYTCDICGDYYTEEIPIVDHTPMTDAAVSATCVHTGLTEGSHCSVCNKILIEQNATPMVDHTIVTDSAISPNCYHTGLTEGSHCSVCGKVFIQQTVLPIVHNYEEATCYLPETCSICGATRGNALGHDYHDGTCFRCGFTPVTGILISKSTLSIHAGDTYSLTATVVPENATNKDIVWSSSNKSVATVDYSGKVTALKAGTTTVTASSNGFTVSCTISVKRVLAVVNTSLSTSSQSNGSFSSEQTFLENRMTNSISLNSFESYEDDGIQDVYYNSSGDELRILDPSLGEMTDEQTIKLNNLTKDANTDANKLYSTNLLSSSASVGSVRRIVDDLMEEWRYMECLYVGSHCTVWACITDPVSVRINSAKAKSIGQNFDSNYNTIVNSYGQWYDADSDGKLAIYCYDVNYDYVTNNYSIFTEGYTAGFFWFYDLVDSANRINGISNSDFLYRYMGSDCIHIDTFPTMSDKNNPFAYPLTNVSDCYSTLIHECQHLINYSYKVIDGSSAYYSSDMETFINEAFSMAAEHMICGPNSTASRIKYFNGNKYIPGTSLTNWLGSLSNYSNSYLFGQYIRTRYAQKTNTNGNALFKIVLQTRKNNKGGDTLAIIASLLGTNSTQLIKDFWNAVYLKDSSGSYGFNNEAWANSISPNIYTTTSGNSSGIYDGGCKYYEINSNSAPTKLNGVEVTLH